MTAQAAVREEAPCGTKQNFGCWEEPLRNPGRRRRGPPGLAQPKRGFPEAAPQPAGTTRGPRVRGPRARGAPASRGDAWPRHPVGSGTETRGMSAGDADGGAGRATGAGRSGGRRAREGPGEGPFGPPPRTQARPVEPVPRPGVGTPLALFTYLPRGLRSPLFGRPQP